jgi:tRNA G18 (ribose-2'-O)-methylase SpoU
MRATAKRQFFKDMILSRHAPPGPFPLVVILDHLKPTYNVGKIIRTANGLGAREVHLIAMPLFHPGPSRGALRHTRTRSFETFAESYAALTEEGYTLYAMVPGAKRVLGDFAYPEKTAIIIGHEEFGIQFSLEDFPKVQTMAIMQMGAIQSLNASVAMAVASFEYMRQHGFHTHVPDSHSASLPSTNAPKCSTLCSPNP